VNRTDIEVDNMTTKGNPTASIDPSQEETNQLMTKFRACIQDFVADLTITFPEYAHLWSKWGRGDLPVEEWEMLLEYCRGTYPEHFFDLLYKNEEIFAVDGSDGAGAGAGAGAGGGKSSTGSGNGVTVEDVDSDSDSDADVKGKSGKGAARKGDAGGREKGPDVFFLPGVDFRKLYNCRGVSENTKESIWKYLQMILFLIMKTVNNSAAFGESEDLFAGVDETVLQDQMKKTLETLAEFFQRGEGDEDAGDAEGAGDATAKESEKTNTSGFRPDGQGPRGAGATMGDMPDVEELNEHLRSLMGGKIGQFATEIMEEYNKDLNDVFGNVQNAKSVKDVVGHMFKNGNKMKDLLKKIQERFKAKMDSGEISKEDVMKETKQIFDKLKGMKQGKEMNAYMKTMMGAMGGGIGAGLGSGKMRVDMNAMERMIKKEEMAERLRAKAEASRKAKEEATLRQTAPNTFSFTTGEAPAPKSKAQRKEESEKASKELDDLVNFIEAKVPATAAGKGKGSGAGAAKKGGKK
jgi:hypothetical protein